jgi:malonate transporter
MLIIFESILPIFLLVLLGVALRRSPLFNDSLWPGLEQLGYHILFPSLLFLTLAKADFSGMETGAIGAVSILAILVMSGLVFALWPVFARAGIGSATYSSLFQTATRWNAFIALAIAEKLAGPQGLAIVALVMAVIIIPTNLINVGMLVWFSGASRDLRMFLVKIVTNPLIIGCALGLVVNLAQVPVYEPLMVSVDLVARSSLGLGLIMVGAGLRISDALRPRSVALVSVLLKLLAFPALMIGIGLAFGLHGQPLVMLALSASVPTAMNGYVLAKQMGGDAPLYAAAATIQTATSFVTIPIILTGATYVAGG